MKGFFQSLRTCGTLLARVGAALGEVCRHVVGAERTVVRAFTSAKVRDESAESVPTVGGTTIPPQYPGLPATTMTFSGPVCRMEVAFRYVPPARGIPVLLRELERV
jgi:hypothetical protein